MPIMFLSNRDKMRKSYRGPSIDASRKMLLYLAKWFQRQELPMAAPFVNRSGQKQQSY